MKRHVIESTETYPCGECGQVTKATDYHPYLYCLLYKAGIEDQEATLRLYGFVRTRQYEKAPLGIVVREVKGGRWTRVRGPLSGAWYGPWRFTPNEVAA